MHKGGTWREDEFVEDQEGSQEQGCILSKDLEGMREGPMQLLQQEALADQIGWMELLRGEDCSVELPGL